MERYLISNKFYTQMQIHLVFKYYHTKRLPEIPTFQIMLIDQEGREEDPGGE
jgi:hypothetical protein